MVDTGIHRGRIIANRFYKRFAQTFSFFFKQHQKEYLHKKNPKLLILSNFVQHVGDCV